ncbi:MAG: pyridoxamine 5'-phosphate oxidase [Deltaproteobacteria bacterium RBG_13_52_11]|nr:MAG: pyridoxamine 5'-phosphate oxidase [Deltaproteobacteria bacterium RBG_13_52_11]
MDFNDCIQFATKHRVAYFATEEGGQPRVRPIGLWFADKDGFYFQAQTVKAFCKQLQNNKKVEVCFHAPAADGSPGTVLRVAGEVQFIDDAALKRKVLEDRPFLKHMGINAPDDPRLAIFRIHTGEAFFWTMEYSMRESEIERIKF